MKRREGRSEICPEDEGEHPGEPGDGASGVPPARHLADGTHPVAAHRQRGRRRSGRHPAGRAR